MKWSKSSLQVRKLCMNLSVCTVYFWNLGYSLNKVEIVLRTLQLIAIAH